MPKLPLENIRVLDLSMVYAGPTATRVLSDMGAQVIKVEAALHPDRVRRLIFPENKAGEQWWDTAAYFTKRNLGKYGVSLDLSTPEGLDIVKRLVCLSDVVVENYTPRVMRHFGLDYPRLRAIKPDVILLSMSGYGQDGPYSPWMAYGMGLEAAGGITSLTGYGDGVPRRTGISFTDPITGIAGAAAVLLALRHWQRTGQGQHIDLSQQEAAATLVGDAFFEYTMNGRVPGSRGNSHPAVAPHGCYRCKGEDRWVVIAVGTDREWRNLCKALGNPPWARDKRFSTTAARLGHREELDRHLEEWTSQHDHYAAMHILQSAGVPAGAVLDAREILLDPHLRARGLFETVEQPLVGKRPYPRQVPARFDGRSLGARGSAPRFDQHTRRVLSQLLGMSTGEMDALEQAGVTATKPAMELLAESASLPLDALARAGAILPPDPDYRQKLGLDGESPP